MHLTAFPRVFTVTPERVELGVELQCKSATLELRSERVGDALSQLRDAGVIAGWRDELYPVLTSFYEPPALLLERAASPFFGIKAYGT